MEKETVKDIQWHRDAGWVAYIMTTGRVLAYPQEKPDKQVIKEEDGHRETPSIRQG